MCLSLSLCLSAAWSFPCCYCFVVVYPIHFMALCPNTSTVGVFISSFLFPPCHGCLLARLARGVFRSASKSQAQEGRCTGQALSREHPHPSESRPEDKRTYPRSITPARQAASRVPTHCTAPSESQGARYTREPGRQVGKYPLLSSPFLVLVQQRPCPHPSLPLHLPHPPSSRTSSHTPPVALRA